MDYKERNKDGAREIIHIILESRATDSEDAMSGEKLENNDDTLFDALDDELRR